MLALSRARASMRYAQARPARSAAQKKSQKAFEILVLRSVTGQSCYRSYRYPYTLVLLKWSHRSFVYRELVKKPRRLRWSENHATTFERSVFSKSHTTEIL